MLTNTTNSNSIQYMKGMCRRFVQTLLIHSRSFSHEECRGSRFQKDKYRGSRIPKSSELEEPFRVKVSTHRSVRSFSRNSRSTYQNVHAIYTKSIDFIITSIHFSAIFSIATFIRSYTN